MFAWQVTHCRPITNLSEPVSRGDVFHDLVAVGAGDAARLVGAPLPEEPRPFRVAGETHGVALLDRRLVVPREGDQPADALAAARLRVRLAGAVAALTGQPLPHVPRLLQEEAPHLCVLELRELLLMTRLAGLGADVAGRGGGGLGLGGGRALLSRSRRPGAQDDERDRCSNGEADEPQHVRSHFGSLLALGTSPRGQTSVTLQQRSEKWQ